MRASIHCALRHSPCNQVLAPSSPVLNGHISGRVEQDTVENVVAETGNGTVCIHNSTSVEDVTVAHVVPTYTSCNVPIIQSTNIGGEATLIEQTHAHYTQCTHIKVPGCRRGVVPFSTVIRSYISGKFCSVARRHCISPSTSFSQHSIHLSASAVHCDRGEERDREMRRKS